MKTFTSPIAGFAAGLVLAVALVFALRPTPSGAQQEQPIVTGDVSTQVAALSAQLTELQAKVDRMDAERGRVKSPFVVMDEAGTAVFMVSIDNGQPYLTIGGGTHGRAIIQAMADGAKLTLATGSDQPLAVLDGRAGTSVLSLSDSNMTLDLGTRSDGTSGLIVRRGEGGSYINLVATDRSGEIYLNGTGGTVFAVQNQDAPLMTLRNPSGQPLFGVGLFEGKPVMTLREEGSGRVQIGIATQGGAPYVSIFDATTERVTIAGGATPEISLADTQGGDVFNVTGADKPTLTLGRVDAPRIALAGGGDAAYLSLFDATVERIGLYGGTDTRITLSNAQGEAILTGGGNPDADKPVLIVGKPGAARVELGVARDGTGSFTRWLDGAGTYRALVEGKTDSAALVLRDSEAGEFFNVSQGASFPVQLALGQADKPRILLGTAPDGSGTYATFWDTGQEPAVSIKAGAAQTMLELRDSNMHARLGTVDDTKARLGLYVGKGDKTYLRANIGGGGEGGGEFVASNDSGKPVAGLIATDAGGSLMVMGPTGGVAVAQVTGTDHGGEIAVFAPSGDRRAGMESSASGEGVFSVMGQGGSVDMTSGQTAPRLIVQKEGRQYVYLGANTSGEGVVKAGPGGNGVAGTLGSGLTAASSLQGKAE